VPPSTSSGKKLYQHIDHPREPPEIVYSGGDRPILRQFRVDDGVPRFCCEAEVTEYEDLMNMYSP